MSINVTVNGQNFIGFMSASIQISFLEANGHAQFSATFKPFVDGIYPVRVQDQVQVLVDNFPVITGFVDKLTSYIDDAEHTIRFGIRDSLADLVDSTLDATITNEIRPSISLKDVCEIVLKKLNINVNVIDNTNIKKFEKGDLIIPKLKDTAFDFLEKYAQKRQVIIRASGTGDLLIERGGKEGYFTTLDVNPNTLGSIIKSATLSIDFTKRYNKYILETQGSGAIANFRFLDNDKKAPILEAVNNVTATTFDNEIRNSRQYCFSPKTTYIKETAQQRVIWEANIRRAQSLVYTCKVTGYTALLDSELWKVNRLVLINDVFNNISDEMLIDSVIYNLTNEGGKVSTLKLVSKDAYSLQAQKDERTKLNTQDATSFVNNDKT